MWLVKSVAGANRPSETCVPGAMKSIGESKPGKQKHERANETRTSKKRIESWKHRSVKVTWSFSDLLARTRCGHVVEDKCSMMEVGVEPCGRGRWRWRWPCLRVLLIVKQVSTPLEQQIFWRTATSIVPQCLL